MLLHAFGLASSQSGLALSCAALHSAYLDKQLYKYFNVPFLYILLFPPFLLAFLITLLLRLR